MRMKWLPLVCILASLSFVGAARSAGIEIGLDFSDIEHRYDGSDSDGRERVSRAVVIGSKLDAAIQILTRAGARCKASRRDAETVRCLYNRMSNDGDALDEVRWTTILHAQGDTVSNLSVDREVDTRVIG